MSAPDCHTRPIHRIRWANFRELIGDEQGAIAAAADRIGKSPGQVSHFGGRSPVKIIGDVIAAQIEQAYDLPDGWLDVNNSSSVTGDTLAPAVGLREIEAVLLSQAMKWVFYEESKAGRVYHPLRRAERLIALYRQIDADGGVLSPERAEAIISSQGDFDADYGHTKQHSVSKRR